MAVPAHDERDFEFASKYEAAHQAGSGAPRQATKTPASGQMPTAKGVLISTPATFDGLALPVPLKSSWLTRWWRRIFGAPRPSSACATWGISRPALRGFADSN